MKQPLLLLCRILSPLLYIAGDVGMALTYEGYSYLHQTVSELNAIGAPTRGLSIGLGFAENILLISFGSGIWMAVARNRKLQVVAGALVSLGAFGFWPIPFASMQMRGTEQEGPHLLSGVVGGKPSHFFFLLVAPETSAGAHLKAMARISRIARNETFRDSCMKAHTREDLFRIIVQEDEKH